MSWSPRNRCRERRPRPAGRRLPGRPALCWPASRRPGGSDPRHRGDSYKTSVYDDIAPRVLSHVVASAALIADVEDAVDQLPIAMPDQFRLARIRRERQQATQRLEVDRDPAAWKVGMIT